MSPFAKWIQDLFQDADRQRKTPAQRPKRYVRRLACEQLEDRVVPATIITIVTGAAGTGSLDAFLSATDGTINATDSLGVAGTVSTGTLQTVNATTQISITAEQSILFNAASLNLLTANANSAQFIALNGNITFGAAGNAVSTAGGDFTFATNGGLLTLGSLNSNGGNISILADQVSIPSGASINAGSNATGSIVTIRPITDTINIDLGGADVANTTLGLDANELGRITAARILRVGGQTITGTIAISSAITLNAANVATLSLQNANTGTNPLVGSATGAITQTAALSVANLATQTVGGVQLTNAGNNIGTVAASVTGGVATVNNFRLVDAPAGTLTVGTVDGLAGVTVAGANFLELTTTGALTLTNGLTTGASGLIGLMAGGAVTQGAGASSAVSTANLVLLGAGPYTLTNFNNNVSRLAASVTSAVSYTDADALRIDSLNPTDGFGGTVDGVSTTNAAIAVNTVNGTLTVQNTAAAIDVNAGTSTVALTAGSTGAADNALTLNGGSAVTGTGGVTLTADNMSVGGTVNAGTNVAAIRQFANGTLISLGGADGTNTLGLTDTELDFVTAGIILIGDSNAGDITTTAAIDTANTNQLELVTGAGIVDGVAGLDITETRLALTAVTGIGSAVELNTIVSNLEATTATGNIRIVNFTNSLTLGGVNGTLTGVRTTTSGNIEISNNTTITVGTAVAEGVSTAGGGSISLFTSSNDINVTATSSGVASTGGNGNVTINAEDNVNIAAAISAAGTGDISITAEPNLGGAGSLTTAGNGTITASSGDISLNGADNVNIGAAVTVTAGTGTIAIVAEPTTGFSSAAGNYTSTAAGTLSTFGGAISIQAGDSITVGGQITAGGAGTFTATADAAMDNIGNFSNAAAISAGGAVLVTANNVTINATVDSTAGGAITLQATTFNGGDVNINSNVTASGGSGNILIQADAESDLNATVSAAGTGTITYDTDFDASGTGELQINGGGGLVTAGGDITFQGQDLDIISGVINATTGATSDVVILTRDLTDVISIGTANPANTLGLDQNDFSSITAGVLNIGSTATNTGGISVDSQITLLPANVPVLSLETAGAIVDGTVADVQDDIIVDSLALIAGTGIGDGDTLNIAALTNLAISNSTSGNVFVSNRLFSANGTLNLTTVDGVVGVANNGAGAVFVSNHGAMNVLELVTATGGGNIDLTTSGTTADINLSTNGAVVASGGTGDITLDTSAATSGGAINVSNTTAPIEIRASGATGDILLNARGAVTFAANSIVQGGNTAAGGDITANANVGVPGGGADITLGAGVNITTRGNVVLSTDPDGILTGTAQANIVMDPTSIIKGNGNTAADNTSLNITLRADGDITVSNAIALNTAMLVAAGNILDDGAATDTTFIQGTDINLSAGGRIGGFTAINPVDLFSGNTAAPTAQYRAAIDYDLGTGTLTVSQANNVVANGTGGNVQLRQVDDALDANPETVFTSDFNFTQAVINSGNQLALISSAGDLRVDNGFVVPSNANALLATVNGFSVQITTGALNNPGANATTTLIASGLGANIDGPAVTDGTADIVGTNLTLITTGGTIGAVGTAGATALEINVVRLDGDTTGLGAGALATPAGGIVNLIDTQNGISISRFTTGTAGDFTLVSQGNILGGSSIVAVTPNDNVAEVVGDVVSLTATGTSTGNTGQIGAFSAGAGQFFEVDANVLNAATNNSRLWISEVGTAATAGTQIGLVTAGTNTAFLRVRNGGNLTSEPSDAGVADVVGASVNLSAPEGGNFGSAGSALEIDASTALTATVTGIGLINITDTTGGLTAATATTGTGDITLTSLGGAMTVTSATPTVSGSILLQAVGGLLTVTNAVTPIGDIVLQTTTSGSINIAKATTAGGSFSANSAADIIFTGTVGPVASATTTATLAAIGAIVGSTTPGVTDLQAASLSAGAGTGIGSGADALATSVSTLAASSGTGGIFISNTAATTTIGTVGALTGVTAVTSGDISITGSAALTVSNVITATSGNVSLTAPGATNVNAAVSGTSVTSTTGALTSTAPGTITGTAGAVGLTSTGAVALGGNVSGTTSVTVAANGGNFGNTGTVGSSAGPVLLTASGGATIGGIVTSGTSTTVTAAGGAVSTTAAITATTTVGLIASTDVTIGGAVSGTAITATANGGNLTTTAAVTGTGPVSLTSSAATSIGGTVGGSNITATGGTTLTTTAAGAITATGTVGLTASAGALTVGAAVGAGGAVTLTSIDTAATTNNVVLNAAVSTTGSTITITAGDSATINAALTTAASGTVNVLVDQGAVDVGVGGTVTVATAVTVTGATAFNFTGGADDDTFNLKPFGPTTPTTLTGGAGTDSLTLDLAGTTTPTLTPTALTNGAFTFGNRGTVTYSSIESLAPTNGTVELVIDLVALGYQDGNANPDVVAFSTTAGGVLNVTVQSNSAGLPTTAYTGLASGISKVTVLGSTDRETFNVDETNSGLPLLVIQGNTPATAPGDKLDINFTNATSPVYTPVAVGSGGYVFGNRSPINFTGIEVLPAAIVSVATTDATAAERGDDQAADIGIITLTRVGDTTLALSVSYTVFGNAINGVDYLSLSGIATFAAGAATTTVVITPKNDTLIEGTEGVGFQLLAGAGYIVAPASTAVIQLLDNDRLSSGYITSTAGGQSSDIRVFSDPNTLARVLTPFVGYTGGIVVAVGDVNGDGIQDFAAAVATGGAPHVKVYDGATGAERLSFFAFDSAYLGGVTIALADLNGDGRAELIVGSTVGVSNVKVFDGLSGAVINSFFAYTDAAGAPAPTGVTVAAGDLDGDGKAEIITGANSSAPHVKIFNIGGNTLGSFFAFDPAVFGSGISIAAGDLDGDGKAEIAAGVNAGGLSLVNVIYSNGGGLRGPLAIPGANPFGPSLGIGDFNGDGTRELLVAVGPRISFFDGLSLGLSSQAFPYADYAGGVYIGA